jgi:hypothetical protein
MLTPNIHPTEGMVPVNPELAKFSWIAIGIWGLSMTCIKVSIALTLLRIQRQSLWWRIFLYTIMGLQVSVCSPCVTVSGLMETRLPTAFSISSSTSSLRADRSQQPGT